MNLELKNKKVFVVGLISLLSKLSLENKLTQRSLQGGIRDIGLRD